MDIVNAGETVAPAGTVTVAGTAACGSLLLSETTAPPAGAGPFSFTTFDAVEPPPARLPGDRLTTEIAGGVTVSVAGCVSPL